jgi:hypothetical protein
MDSGDIFLSAMIVGCTVGIGGLGFGRLGLLCGIPAAFFCYVAS